MTDTRVTARPNWPDLLPIPAVALQLGVHKVTVYAWIKAGKLPAVQLGGRFRVDPAAVAAFMRPVVVEVADDAS